MSVTNCSFLPLTPVEAVSLVADSELKTIY